ncbi:MAG TPA: hypothetical protein VI233_06915 [Puia sp.]
MGPLVFLLLCYFIQRQITHQHNWQASLSQIKDALTGPLQWRLWLVIALMPVNWGVEARKWQLALRPIERIPFSNAMKAIFTGVTLASFTPNRMGEYLGRILYIKDGHRLSAISLTIACSIAQLLVTVIIGLAGVLYLKWVPHNNQPGLDVLLDILLVLTPILLVSLTFLYFRISWVAALLSRIPLARKYAEYIKVLQNFDATILMRILFLSFGRYIVFITQYSLIFPVFGVSLGFGQVWGGMSVVFLVMAVVPTFTFLTELGFRWEASIQVLELFSSNMVGVFAASFAIWLINLIIPALIGSLLILSIKLFKSR